MSTVFALLLAATLLAGNAFFVGAEFALISARRTQVEPLAAAGSKRARSALAAMEQLPLMMAGAQLGITLCSLGLGALGEPVVAHLLEGPLHLVGVGDELLHPISFTLALLLVVFLHVVLGEMVPKNVALAGPERAVLALAPPLALVVRVLKPFIWALNTVAKGILKLFKVTPREEIASAYTLSEVAALVSESRAEGLLDDDEHALLTGVLEFDQGAVSSVLIPLERLVSLQVGATVAEVEEVVAETGYSRLPVQDEDGGLVGYLHLKDVLEVDPTKQERVVPVKRVRQLATVRLDDRLGDALAAMQARGAHLARVVDADGRTIGLVALEDVLEELVGEIRDATSSHT